MLGRSRWLGGLFASFVSVAAALGCSQLPSYDGKEIAADPNAPPPATHGPRQLTPVDVDAVALAADDSGIYWTSLANKLWFLPAQVPLPVPLAADAGVIARCTRPTRPLLSPPYVFWVGADRAALHRTQTDGTDDRLAWVASGDNLVSDGSAVYWTEASRGYADGYVDGSVIRSLPADAAPGSAPVTVLLSFEAISSFTVIGGIAYWTPFPNATVYYSDVWTAPVQALATGQAGTKLAGLRSPYDLTRAGGELYFAFYQDLATTGLAHLAPDRAEESIAVLPISEYGVGLAVTGGWLLASTYSEYGCGAPASLNLWATPLGGGAPKLIAQGMRTAAVVAPQGIVFVDGNNHLVALAPEEIDRIVSPVP